VKTLKFAGSSQNDLRNFPTEARRDAGFQLHFVQVGQTPFDWKPLNVVGAGVMEIRIRREGEWRIVYLARFEDSVYVLHAFQKKTQRTSRTDIDLARARYKEIEALEKAKQKEKQQRLS